MARTGYVISILLALCLCAPNARADHIVLAADLWCPINCEPGSERPGFMVEIAEQVFAGAGHTVEYRTLPWPRAIAMAREGKISGIIGAFRGDAPDFIFPENELAVIANNFFVTRQSTWTYTGIDSLREVKLGTITGYDYGELTSQYLIDPANADAIQSLSGDKPLERNISKLLLGRVDVVVETAPVFWHMARQMGVSDKLRCEGPPISPKKTYIAFSPAIERSAQYARTLSDGVADMRASGELKKMMARYGLD